MNARVLERLAWIASILFVGSAVADGRKWSAQGAAPAPLVPAATQTMSLLDSDSLDDMAGAIASTDPFRISHHPSAVPFDPAVGQAVGPAMGSSPGRPLLVLKAIVGGPPWEAVLEGVPGREGDVLVTVGDRIGQLAIKAVTTLSVTVSLPDTTYRLSFARAEP